MVLILQEICLLRVLSFDPNMVQFYGACLDPGCPMLVLEYMEGGDLHSCIKHDCYPQAVGDFKWYKKGGRIALDVAKGLVFLHEQKASQTCSCCSCISRVFISSTWHHIYIWSSIRWQNYEADGRQIV